MIRWMNHARSRGQVERVRLVSYCHVVIRGRNGCLADSCAFMNVAEVGEVVSKRQVWCWGMRLCKKESQLQSKKTDFSQEKSRKSQKKVKKIDFSLTFLD